MNTNKRTAREIFVSAQQEVHALGEELGWMLGRLQRVMNDDHRAADEDAAQAFRRLQGRYQVAMHAMGHAVEQLGHERKDPALIAWGECACNFAVDHGWKTRAEVRG